MDGENDNQENKPRLCQGLKELKGEKSKTSQFWQIDDENENENSKIKVMYRKKEVYLGINECSFEELKALKERLEKFDS